MNELVKLLNKFEKEKIINEWWYVDEDDEYFWRSIKDWEVVNWSYDRDAHWFMKYYIISKDFKFIERLVKNDKIDIDKVKENWIKHNGRMDVDGLYRYSVYERVLMLLAIQDEPINFLIQLLN